MKIGNLEVYGIIYKITNVKNGKVYIGQTTKDFKGRYSAKGIGIERVYKRLKIFKKRNKCYNEHLLNSIQKYGFNSFDVCEVFDVAFSRDELNIKEVCWISIYDSYKNGYNSNYGGDGNSGFDGLKKENNPASRRIVQLTLEGTLIKKWDCMAYASENTGASVSKISAVCRGERYTTSGYRWMFLEDYESKDEIKPYKRKKSNTKEVVQLSLDLCYINEYTTMTSAAEYTGSNLKNISACCNKSKKTHNGFIWMYKSEYEKINI